MQLEMMFSCTFAGFCKVKVKFEEMTLMSMELEVNFPLAHLISVGDGCATSVWLCVW